MLDLCAANLCLPQADLVLGMAFTIENLRPLYAPLMDTAGGMQLHRRLCALLSDHKRDLALKAAVAATLSSYCRKQCELHGVAVDGSGAAVGLCASTGDVLPLDSGELTVVLSTWALSPYVDGAVTLGTLQLAEAMMRVTVRKPASTDDG